MGKTLEGGLAPLTLANQAKIVIEARDPVTGNAVTGVTVSNVNIYGIDLTADSGVTLEGPFMWVPGPQA